MTARWDRRSAEEHARVESLVLERWLPAALTVAPFWADRAEELGLEASSLTDGDGLRRLPPVREADVVAAGGAGAPGLVMRPTEGQIKAFASTDVIINVARAIRRDGTDAKRRTLLEEYRPIQLLQGGQDGHLAIASSRSDLDRMHRTGARAAGVLGLSDGDRLLNAVGQGPTLGFWGVHHLALGASMLAIHPRGAGEDLEAALRGFDTVTPTVVVVPLEEAVSLAALVLDAGRDCSRVERVVTLGPPPDAASRRAVAEAWQAAGSEPSVKVLALWAPPEARALWAECEADSGLHTYPDLEVVEILDPLTGEPADGGGDLTITTAGWHGTALLRLQTGCYVDGTTDVTCPGCGRTVPRITGEVAPSVWTPLVTGPGSVPLRLDLRGLAIALGTTPEVQTWRIELRKPTARLQHDRIVVEVGGDIDEPTTDDLAVRLEAAAGMPITKVNVVSDPVLVERNASKLGTVFADLR